MGKVIQFPVGHRTSQVPEKPHDAGTGTAGARLFDAWFAMLDTYAALWRRPVRPAQASSCPVRVEARRETGRLG